MCWSPKQVLGFNLGRVRCAYHNNHACQKVRTAYPTWLEIKIYPSRVKNLGEK